MSEDEGKSLFWQLSKELHPDINGSNTAFSDMKDEYENFKVISKFMPVLDLYFRAKYRTKLPVVVPVIPQTKVPTNKFAETAKLGVEVFSSIDKTLNNIREVIEVARKPLKRKSSKKLR
jgi:myosin-crossreactive antigen